MKPILLGILVAMASPPVRAHDTVVLLHGLLRSSHSMKKMEAALTAAGYEVLNVDYPSRTASVADLADATIGPIAARAATGGSDRKVHFVTHSMGGILVRQYLSRRPIPNLGRVVMLGPPNRGSEVVDRLGDWKAFGLLHGPAGRELGTAEASTPNRLGPVSFELGVIAGDRSINWINSLLIPGPDDGKVSVERTRIAGMKDHVTLHATHPFLMKNGDAIRQTLHFLRQGRFAR